MHILVTGAAGFIGADLSLQLLTAGHSVVGIDNFNDYYDVSLKQARVKRVLEHKNSQRFSLLEMDIVDRDEIKNVFEKHSFDVVVNLAAQAGVRYSIENPESYIE